MSGCASTQHKRDLLVSNLKATKFKKFKKKIVLISAEWLIGKLNGLTNTNILYNRQSQDREKTVVL